MMGIKDLRDEENFVYSIDSMFIIIKNRKGIWKQDKLAR